MGASMKCAKCGAPLKVGCIYCSTCGHEAQIVSDYNVLEDELLTSLMKEGEPSTIQPASKKQPVSTKQPAAKPQQPVNKTINKKKKKKSIVPFIIAGITLALVITLVIFLNVRNYRSNSFEYQYSQGLLAKNSGDYAKAITYLKRALELDDDNIDVMMELAKLYQKRDNKEYLEAILLQMIAQDKENRDAYTMLISLYDSQKKYDKILSLQDSLQDSPLKSMFADYAVEAPRFSETPGSYNEEMTVELLAKEGHEIYFTLDDTDPVNGQKYVSALAIEEGNTVIKAIVKDSRGLYSEVIRGEYQVKFEAPANPVISPKGGTYTEEQQITITIPVDCTAYYTWDDTTPTRESTRYEGSIQMPEGNNVLSVIVYGKHDLSSRVVKCNYIYQP